MLKTPLGRYRLMAYIVASYFSTLCLVGLPLQFAAHQRWVKHYPWVIHGYLYIAYVILAIEIAFRYRFSLVRAICVIASGTIPFMGFVAERSVTRFVRARDARTRADVATVPASAD